ncbi:MAG TPA: hypothetical protein VHA52_13405 [Candidatus Babeliaceae bacterium]|nr:hypothetical protein [Candidatus Babeliaceae bacterium]
MLRVNTTFMATKIYLVISSALLGWSLWYILGDLFPTQLTVTVPLYFYNATSEQLSSLTYPEKLTLTLKGYRKDLRSINYKELALHINFNALASPISALYPEAGHLLLPQCIKIINSSPLNIAITNKQSPLNSV